MKRVAVRLRTYRSLGLHLLGLGGISASLWLWFGVAAGVLAAGLSCLVVEYLTREGSP